MTRSRWLDTAVRSLGLVSDNTVATRWVAVAVLPTPLAPSRAIAAR